jgi:hypothetical protein
MKRRARAEVNRMITGDDLENRQENGTVPERRPRPGQEALARGIARAMTLKPGKNIHCGCCWGQGRAATIQAIRDEEQR